MIRRWLDVLFEWAAWLGAALFLIPAMVGVVALVVDRSELVTAKIWTNRPALLKDSALANSWSNGAPAGDADALLTELMGSDWFANEVLKGADSGFVNLSSNEQAQLRLGLRQNLKHQADGLNLLSISYRTDRPQAGRSIMSSVIVSLGNAGESDQSLQTGAVVQVLHDQVAAAGAARQRALDAVNAYAARKSQAELLWDPVYQTLVVDATTATDYYVSVENQAKQAQLQQLAVPAIRQATFRVVDAPSISPKQFDLRTPAVRYYLEALAGTAGVEILLVYVIGLRDPRVRSGDDVKKLLGIAYLGSTPALPSTA